MNPVDHKRVQKICVGETRTRQSEAEETDVNRIVARHRKTGVVTHLSSKAPVFGDVSMAVDLKAAFDLVNEAAGGFLELPAAVRQAALNDPVKLLEMLSTPEGTQALREAGLGGVDERDAAASELPFRKGSKGPAPAAAGPQAETGPQAAEQGPEGDSTPMAP